MSVRYFQEIRKKLHTHGLSRNVHGFPGVWRHGEIMDQGSLEAGLCRGTRGCSWTSLNSDATYHITSGHRIHTAVVL